MKGRSTLRRRQDRLAAHEHFRREGRERRRESRDAVRPVSALRLAEPMPAGKPLVLGIRPPDIRLATGAPAGERADGSAARAARRRHRRIADFERPCRSEWCCRRRRRSGIKEGDRLPIVIDPAKIHVFRGHNGSAISRNIGARQTRAPREERSMKMHSNDSVRPRRRRRLLLAAGLGERGPRAPRT